jgi:hypothetical protein
MGIVCLGIGCSAEAQDKLTDGRAVGRDAYRYEGHEVVEGDILLDPAEAEAAGDPASADPASVDTRSLAPQTFGTSVRLSLWPGKRVPYVISGEISLQGRAAIDAAIAQYRDRVGIEFVPRRNEWAHVVFRASTDPNACYSRIGRALLLQPQGIFISRNGGGCVIHEMGHALGLYHEQSRPDRNRYVRINTQNVERRYASNFDRQFFFVRSVGEYDFGSMMHYPPYAFSKNGQPTITRLDGTTSGIGENRTTLSDGDVAILRALYDR